MTVPRGRTYCVRVSGLVAFLFGRVVGGRVIYLSGLLEWLLVNSDEDDGVWAKSVGGGGLDVLDDVLGGLEVDEGVGAKVLAELSLVLAGVDADGAETHGLGVLLGERAQSSTGTDDGDGLAGLGTGLLQALVDGDTGTCEDVLVVFLVWFGDGDSYRELGRWPRDRRTWGCGQRGRPWQCSIAGRIRRRCIRRGGP